MPLPKPCKQTQQPLSAAARLLVTGGQVPPLQLRRQFVVHVASEELADGLQQWPDTRGLIQERLGPTALAIAEGDADALRERLQVLAIELQTGA